MTRLVAVALVWSSASLAAQPPADSPLRAEAQRRVAAVVPGPARVTVMVDASTAVLDGTVPNLWVKRQAINAALKTPGIDKVQSTIAIEAPEGDDLLAAQVANAIGGYSRYTVFDYVDGSVRHGAATLTGMVTTEQKLDQLIERVEKVRGLQGIDNQIKVPAVSQSDDRLRVVIARQIYADSAFQQYSLANPPVHVLVEHGRVTLVGIVSGSLERQKAYAIARMTPGVLAVDNQVKLRSEVIGQ